MVTTVTGVYKQFITGGAGHIAPFVDGFDNEPMGKSSTMLTKIDDGMCYFYLA